MKTCKVSFPEAKSEYEALIALSDQEQEIGLMGRLAPLPPMIFPYGNPKVNRFWMKNTRASLDIIFCRDNKIINICQGQPYSTALVGSDDPSDLVIELPAGTCEANSIKIGNTVSISYDKETAMQIFALKNNIRY